VNVYGKDWDVERSPRGTRERFAHAVRSAGGEALGGTVFEVEPGWSSYFHVHHANEELLLVLDGSPTLRTGAGEQELRPGDVALFRRGSDGGHSIVNTSGEAARFVVFSTMISPDVAEQPEEGTLGVFAGDSPTAGRDAPLELFFRKETAIGYFDVRAGDPE
jgi:uncharacterized cupin superfamily protein